MENLIFSLNATLPVFLMMLLGVFLKKINWIDDQFASKLNQFVFRLLLPLLVFEDLATVDFREVWNVPFLLFCFGATVLSVAFAILLSHVWRDRTIQGEFIQATYRSSAAILGLAFIQNIYGTSGMAPMMIIGSVPVYNIMAVVVLSFFQPERKGINGALVKKTAINVLKNPIIIGIVVGFLWSLLQLPLPEILMKVVTKVGGCATPLGLISMGASFELKKALNVGKPAITASLIKLCGFVMVFLPMAIAMGFRNEELVAILVMLGSATTVSCYVMARNMGHEGVLTSGVVMLTTLLAAFTLTFWLYLLRSMAYI